MFRFGTTSYIIPADILPNAEWLAGRVDDIQLVLFETDTHGSNLPDAALRQRLRGLTASHGLTYSVHLPLDLRLADGGAATDESIVKAHQVIDATLELNPTAYTVHLHGGTLPREFGGDGSQSLEQWRAGAKTALLAVASQLPDPALLSVENLENWNPAAFAPLFDELPVSRAVDIGHLWLEKKPVFPALAEWLPRTRLIHIHGTGTRDHQSLIHAPQAELRQTLEFLRDHFTGVVTLEVFNEPDFQSSMELMKSLLSYAEFAGENVQR